VRIACVIRKSVVGILVLAGAAGAQSERAKATFEVAAVKVAAQLTAAERSAGKVRVGLSIDEARVNIGAFSMANLIGMAYAIKLYQVSGPDWIAAEKYDIQAKMREGSSRDQIPEMLQALLEERFKLAVHRDRKELPVYTLVVGKNGLKMRELPLGTQESFRFSPKANGIMHFEITGNCAAIARFLAPYLDRPTFDETGEAGIYQMVLDVERSRIAPTSGDSSGPLVSQIDQKGAEFFQPIEQLGLKLEPRKRPVEMIIVDHVEKAPTEN